MRNEVDNLYVKVMIPVSLILLVTMLMFINYVEMEKSV